jgi:hypothetical protein
MPHRLIFSDFSDAKTSPPLGVPIEVMPGILWIRLALPFQLNHVNIYLIDDGDGWAVFDTGLGDTATQAVWTKLLADHIDRPLTRLIVTHICRSIRARPSTCSVATSISIPAHSTRRTIGNFTCAMGSMPRRRSGWSRRATPICAW